MAPLPKPPVRVALAGLGAFGQKHLAALGRIDDVRLVAVVDTDVARSQAASLRVPGCRAAAALRDVLDDDSVDAVILCTPTPDHARQAIECLAANKHVLIEIPLADSLADAQAVVQAQRASGKVAMCGHTRRFNPSHQWVHQRVERGEFRLLHLDVQTLFMRRSNVNLQGEPRSWTDHLLWHHAAHTVDLFAWQTGEAVVAAHVLQGPIHSRLGIAMDMSIQLKSSGGALCTLALSFNDAGPQGSFFRYIGDSGTYLARYDDLSRADGQAIDVTSVDVSTDGIELQDREFVSSILAQREPRTSVGAVFNTYEVLDRLSAQLDD